MGGAIEVRFSSIKAAPRQVPPWQVILEDLGNPHPTRIAKVLGVSVRTVYRWQSIGDAPRTACLALFWLTQWGRSQVHAQAVNDATNAIGYAKSLERELKAARLQLAGPGAGAAPQYEPLGLTHACAERSRFQELA